jgi:uncharacterized Zn-binding protein involved in type VI secretion
MPLNPIARLGDTSTHGGQIVTASPNVRCDGLQVGRNGDFLQCPAHGLQPVTSISNGKRVNGQLILTVGAVAACGAVISSGSPKARSA